MLGCDKCCEERQEQEVGLYSWRVGGVGLGVSSFREWVRDGLIGKVTFEQRPKRGGHELWGLEFQAEGAASAKVLRWEYAWCALE